MMVHTYSGAQVALPRSVAPAVRRIILPLDGTRLAERAVEPTIELARAFQAEVALVRCYEPASQLPSGNASLALLRRRPSVPLHAASLYLARMEETLRRRGVRAYGRLFQWPAAPAILETATHGSSDLVVIATRAGSNDMERLGSVAADILEARSAPILLVTAGTRNTLERGHSRGLRVLAVDGDVAADVEAYAELLAGALHGTVAHVSTLHAGGSQTMAATEALTADAAPPAKQEIPCTIGRLADVARAGADVVVVKGSPPLDGRGSGRAIDLLRATGLPVLVVP
jgi:nucleotide-binding universal stress UspA family protein